tara:strand:- start:192 stop:683 length:492 start_codon:yes stop_codon:yes gene_type:complete
MTYEEISDFIDDLYDCQDVADSSTFTNFAKRVKKDFNGISLDVAKELARDKWNECQEAFKKAQEEFEAQFEEEEKPKPKPKEKPKEVKLTQAQETDIQNVVQNEDLTKREVSIRTLEIVNKPFSLQQFYDETGMVQSTARRELGQAVKRGEIERVSRGVYRRL